MTNNTSPLPDRWFYALAATGVLLNATGLFPPILEPDGALYASIAKTMAQSGDFVNLYAVGSDWLDKPHFPFWVAAVSFRLFGINTFAYKLPALLFFLAGVVYTYRFARLMYPKVVAQVAALVLLTAFHGVVSNSDVRAEPYLTGLIIGAVYHFWRVSAKGGKLHLIAGSLLTGCALMTKGVFVLVPIGAGLVLHWLITGNWRELLKPRWYAAMALSFLFTLPEVYTLYQQFDLHPEKVIFGERGVSGVKFFFWDSQFGRFFNTGPIKGEGDKFFFVHTLLWAFLPWSLPLYAGTGKAIYGLVKRRNPLPIQAGPIQAGPIQAGPEYVSLGSGLATFALFSLSGFQLPHYMNIVFPFFAIITAQFLVSLSSVILRRWAVGQTIIGVLMVLITGALLLLVRPAGLPIALIWVVAAGAGTFLLFRKTDMRSLMGRMVGVMLIFFVSLNLFLYPTWLHYMAGRTAALAVNAQSNKAPNSQTRETLLYMPGTGVGGGSFWSYEFYANDPTRYVRSDQAMRTQVSNGPKLIFTSAAYADSLRAGGFRVRTMATFPYYHVSTLSADFLNADTRAKTLESYILAEVLDNKNRDRSLRSE